MNVLYQTEEILVCQRQIDEKWSDEVYQNNLNLLPKAIQTKIEAYKDWNARQIRIEGKILLLTMLKFLHLNEKYTLHNLKTSPNHKPYFVDASFDFSIAHSENIVVCAIATSTKIGIDLEYLKPIDWALYQDYLTENEIEFLQRSSNTNKDFYTIWTQKEALSKATGLGIIIDFKSVEVVKDRVVYDGQTYQFDAIPINGFICLIAKEVSL
jgi:4'-phosphopantetheinyl transferase